MQLLGYAKTDVRCNSTNTRPLCHLAAHHGATKQKPRRPQGCKALRTLCDVDAAPDLQGLVQLRWSLSDAAQPELRRRRKYATGFDERNLIH